MVTTPAGRVPAARASADPYITPADVSRVLRDDSLHLVAQPVVALETGSIAGYELLARLPEYYAAPPDRWFEAARRCGRVVDLTLAVVHRMHELRPTLPPNTFCSINVEPDLLLQPQITEALAAAGSLHRVVVELTEHVSIERNQVRVLSALDDLRELGATIAVDDAGTGYSGLTQLLRIRPEIVKVDRDLVMGLDHDPIRRAMVELVGKLAGQMDAWLLAEGVETADELATLARLQVPLAQGYHLGRPEEPWSTVDSATAARLRHVWDTSETTHDVMRLVRDCRVCLIGDTDLEPDDVVVDELTRPLFVVVEQSQGRATPVPAMTVAPASDPADVLRRAMSRPAHLRFAPVACTDPSGVLLGIIDMAELVESFIDDNPSAS